MNRFGEIADELTDLMEELERADLAVAGAPLKAALARAFAKACEAERAVRLKADAELQPKQSRGRPARRTAVETEPTRSGVVIQLPLAWRRRRGAAGGARRLSD